MQPGGRVGIVGDGRRVLFKEKDPCTIGVFLMYCRPVYYKGVLYVRRTLIQSHANTY